MTNEQMTNEQIASIFQLRTLPNVFSVTIAQQNTVYIPSVEINFSVQGTDDTTCIKEALGQIIPGIEYDGKSELKVIGSNSLHFNQKGYTDGVEVVITNSFKKEKAPALAEDKENLSPDYTPDMEVAQ